MAIKKYFIDNQEYGTDALNKINYFLRTTGVCGEIADCLRVTAGSSTTVNIADGIGWVDGCAIEVSGGATLTLPTSSGEYSIIMKLDKNADTVNNISFDYTAGELDAPHVLAWVTISGGSITSVVDRRVDSVYRGQTNYPYNIYSGSVTFEQTLTAGQTITKTITVPLSCKKVKGYFEEAFFEVGVQGMNVICANRYAGNDYYMKTRTGDVSTDSAATRFGGFGVGITGDAYIRITAITYAAGVVSIVFKNDATSSKLLSCTIDWEAW